MVWDKNLEYDDVEKSLKAEIKKLVMEKGYYKGKGKKMPSRSGIRLAYYGILYTHLINGSRISEAVDGVMNFRIDKKREQWVEARKRRKNKKNKLINIPTNIKVGFFDALEDKNFKQIHNGIILFTRNYLKINTHSLRYAWVSKQGKDNVPSNITSSYMRHTNPGMIERYTRDRDADEFFTKKIL